MLILFLFLVLCIFTSCKSSNVKSVVAAESKFDLDFFADNEISFSYRNKGYMPLLSLCMEQDSVDKVEFIGVVESKRDDKVYAILTDDKEIGEEVNVTFGPHPANTKRKTNTNKIE